VLLITNQPLTQSAIGFVLSTTKSPAGPMYHVLVRDASDAPQLRFAVHQALGIQDVVN
jgi:hypothetical protein